MKRTLSIILVFIALTNIVGFMPLYFSALQEIKGEVKLKLSDESELKKLQISDAEYSDPALFKITDEGEFIFNGMMYDYKSVKKANGGYTFYALEDTRESGLVDFLKAVYGQSNDNAKSSKAPLANLLKNFSKDFIGCISKHLLLPLSNLSGFSLLAATNTCTGYRLLLQNPPDRAC